MFAFGIEDDISPAKVLAEFSKEFKVLELKSGIFEGKVIDAEGVNEVATLPTLEEALTKLATQLISPVRYIGVGLHQLTEGDHLNASESKEETKTEEVKAEETKEEVAAETPEVKVEEVAKEEASATEETKEEAPKEEATEETKEESTEEKVEETKEGE